MKHVELNTIFLFLVILYLYYSRCKPLKPYIQYVLHYIQLLSTECGNVLYIVWHSAKACACSAKLQMSHQISIQDTIFFCSRLHFHMKWLEWKWGKSALKPSKYSKVSYKVLWKMFSLIRHVDLINVFFHTESTFTWQYQYDEIRSGLVASVHFPHTSSKNWNRWKCFPPVKDWVCMPHLFIAVADGVKNYTNVNNMNLNWITEPF